jgi:hypothetical protein
MIKYYSELNGVYFIEGRPAEAILIEPLSSELNGFFSQNQLKTLDDLKSKMREFILSKGGNCLVDFKYGQRSSFWKSILGMDDVLWYGSGIIARIDIKPIKKGA